MTMNHLTDDDAKKRDLVRRDQARRVERALTTIPTDRVIGLGQEFARLADLDAFMDWVLGTQEMPYAITYETGPQSRRQGFDGLSGDVPLRIKKVKANPQWVRFFNALRICRTVYSLDLDMAPQLVLLLETFARHPIAECGLRNLAAPYGNKLEAEWCNDFVTELRDQAERQQLKRKRHNWELGPRQNLDALIRNLDRLFAKIPSVTAVHWRFSSRKRELSQGELDNLAQQAIYTGSVNEAALGADTSSLMTLPLAPRQSELNDLRAMRNKFFGWIRNRRAYIKQRRGMVWSIERSLYDGYTLHVTMLFESIGLAKDHTDLEAFADGIGKYWGEITDSRGDYEVCHQYPNRYGDWVFGRIIGEDRDKLYRALEYLATKTLLVRIKGLPKGQYFGSAWFDELGGSLDPRRVRKSTSLSPIGRLMPE